MTFARCLLLLGITPWTLVGCGSSDDSGARDIGKTECEHSLSEFAGDCLKLEQPKPEAGFQLHFGPSNYDDTADVARFILQPGDEKVSCLYMTTPNEQDAYFSEYHATARPGTHHMIIFSGQNASTTDPVPPDGVLSEQCKGNLPFLVGAQNGIGANGARIDVPLPGGRTAPENQGLATIIPARSRTSFQVHYVNTGTEPLLEESWANFVYRPAEQVRNVVGPLFWIGGLNMNVPPKTNQVIKAQCVNDTGAPRRLVGLTGHMHAHATRFSVFKVPKDTDERTRVYEEYSWAESHFFGYDSITNNPEPNPEQRIAGASSGDLTLAPGDRVEWECEVHNTSDAALKFEDKAYTAEMCNLFGMFTPAGVGAWNCFSTVD